METCATTTWMKLCTQLLRLTGDSAWADELELTLYNSMIGAMMPEGNWWAYHSPLQGERAPGTCANIEREWSAGDKVSLKLDLSGRIVTAPSGAMQKAIMRGPVVFALDNRLTAAMEQTVWLLAQPYEYFTFTTDFKTGSKDSCILQQRAPLPGDPDGFIELTPAANKPDNVWMAFEVSFVKRPTHFSGHEKVTLVVCDYASAGNRWSADNLFRVWLPQPMYMKNMYPEGSWKMLTRTEVRPTIPEMRQVN